jgi:predicted PurR-regulated permease PerM
MTTPEEPTARRIGWIGWVLIGACAVLLAPLLPPIMLALWLGGLARVLHRPLTRALGGRVRLAAAITLIALSAVLVPFALAFISLAADAYQLVTQTLDSPRGKQILEQLVAPSGHAAPGGSSLRDLVLGQQERAWDILRQVAGTATRVVIELVVIGAGTYAVLVDGSRSYQWLERHAPIEPDRLGRLRDAFFETGRGLFIGIGGAGLLQAIIATIAYLVLGIPRALALGVLTLCCSIVPSVGTALVWAPIAAGLALTGRTGAAIALAICGIAVIGTVDNFMKPVLARRGKLGLPTYIVLVSMFAGVMVIGPWGLLVAPLVVRLARAALESAG